MKIYIYAQNTSNAGTLCFDESKYESDDVIKFEGTMEYLKEIAIGWKNAGLDEHNYYKYKVGKNILKYIDF